MNYTAIAIAFACIFLLLMFGKGLLGMAAFIGVGVGVGLLYRALKNKL